MNVATMTMPRAEAQKKLTAYRKQLHRRADAEFTAAAQGYEALAAGKVLLNIDDVFAKAPCDTSGRPRLAICRADRRQVYFRWGGYEMQATFDGNAQWGRQSIGLVVTVQMERQPSNNQWLNGYAIVPMVPADVLDSVRVGGSTLGEYHVLWEVEQWADSRIRSTPDRDPYLLRHLAGSLWVVVAEWELTDLERAIMSGRRDS